MNVCGTTRLLVPGFVVGLAVATLAGNDLYGWIAAAVIVAILAVVQKLRGTGPTCAISPSADAEAGLGDTGPADLPVR